DRLQRHRRRAEGVFVAGQLDDLGGIEAELPGQLFHRLAGYIGGQFLHAWQRQTEEIATHDKASSYKPQAPSNPLPNRVQLAAGSLPLRLKYRLRIGPQDLQRHGFLTNLLQRIADQRIVLVTEEIDE